MNGLIFTMTMLLGSVVTILFVFIVFAITERVETKIIQNRGADPKQVSLNVFYGFLEEHEFTDENVSTWPEIKGTSVEKKRFVLRTD